MLAASPLADRFDRDKDMTIAELVSLSDEDFLREVYRVILGREIDSSGLEGYRRQLAQGRSRQSVLVSLARSKEAKARFAPPALFELTDEAFVDAVYVRMLGRNADSQGMRHYIGQLRKHGDRMKVLRGIGNSDEARRHDPRGWALRRELEELVRREGSLLGWRKLLPEGRGRTAVRGPGQTEMAVFAKELLQVQREENAALKDQVMLLASAIEGLVAAQKRDAARIDALITVSDNWALDLSNTVSIPSPARESR
ncbi:DUF4214 domain-containing protein [Sphingomonas sp. NFR15]|uniref:DUF4214 domain-containing protein n=1 Tax=Sphingomonas sp. NFR15 TaxID=1566282 RepID=UPI000B80CFCA|nr:DUF4214 domain-containing protein [Sphingomonas sp. NFR15]